MIITIDNGISKISIGDDSCDFKLIAHSGFAVAEYDVQMSPSGCSDGGYITTTRLASRVLTIKTDFSGRNAEDVRQRLIRFFAPSRVLTVTAERGGLVRSINGHFSSPDILENNRFAPSGVSLEILCPDPYFKAVNVVSCGSAVVTPMFRAPAHFPAVFGVIEGGDAKLDNDGDTYADFTAELAANAAVTNPYIRNDANGHMIKILGSMSRGDVLRITVDRRTVSVRLNGAALNPQTHTIDAASRFSEFIEVGLNKFEFGSAEETANLSATIRCTQLYLGI